MRFRKLRIAWSVPWGLASVLLIVLWMRSYYLGDVVQWSVSQWHGLQFTSAQGQLTLRRCSLDGVRHHGGVDFPDWLLSTTPAGSFDKSPAMLGFNLRHLSYFVALPYWALELICAVLAAAPFLIGDQGFQFSVRTLLVATTLVGALLGLTVWALRA